MKSLVTYDGREFNTTVNTFLVRMDAVESLSKGGIIIPSTAQKRTDFSGTVVAVSRTEERTGEIKVGDRVLVTKNEKRIAPTDDPKSEYRLYNKKELLLCTTPQS